MCAGLPDVNNDMCHGDSGGPLIKFHDGDGAHFIQLGKLSFLWREKATKDIIHHNTLFVDKNECYYCSNHK